jgi:hypothetical protein
VPVNDFKQLSSRDFEELSRDLLQAEWGVRLEAFRAGRDQGIDLRHVTVDGGATIVQCKHFAGSGYAKLVAHLRRSELDKVRQLAPERYVLVTSVELSPRNKAVIRELFDPFIISTSDIFGANDIDGLLRRHPEIGRANFKLWLTSTEVLERVLHNAATSHTEFAVERIIRKLPIFVQNAAYPRAREILDERHVLVISGVPGLGKTTLAEILLYAHLDEGYEPVVIQRDVREGKDLFRSQRHQVFYFDDFLGQTFLGEGRFPGGLNSDVSLVDFIDMVRDTNHSRFILTTREHLLQSAETFSERLRHSAILDHRCLLQLADYSRGQRARILYNHLYHGELAREYKEEMLRDDFFLEIIGHKHFSPRLIEWLSTSTRLRNVRSVDYQRHVRSLLADPRAIWSHAFNHQISPAARNLLLTLYTMGPSSELAEIEVVWRALHSLAAQKYNFGTSPNDYLSALKEVDNAFTTYRRGRADFLNPSVREMVAAEISAAPEMVLDLLTSACRFQQLATLFQLAKQPGSAPVRQALSRSTVPLQESIERLLRTPRWRWDSYPDGRPRATQIDIAWEQRVGHVGKVSLLLTSSSLRALFEKEVHSVRDEYSKNKTFLWDAVGLLRLFDEEPQLKTTTGMALQRTLLEALLNVDIRLADQLNALIECRERVSAWSAADSARLDESIEKYRKGGIDEEYDSCSNPADYARLREGLDTLGSKTGVPFTSEIAGLEERIAETDPNDSTRSDDGSWRALGDGSDREADTDDAIREVFGALVE